MYDDPSAGNQVGSTLTRDDVNVSDGLFTVQLDFGNVFDGTALYLEIGVRPGSDTGAYTALSPRQALTPAPYALYSKAAPWSGLTGVPAGFADGVDDDTTYTAGTGLTLTGSQFSVNFAGNGSATTVAHSDHNHDTSYWRLTGNRSTTPGTNFLGTTDDAALEFKVNNARALRLEPNATSPNLIGSYSGNTVASGVYGATIGGGGESSYINRVTANYGTVGGGYNNTASGDDATVGGGDTNTASGDDATVGGGDYNNATADNATVGGGDYNDAPADNATVGGGYGNTASGYAATVPGGFGAAATHYGEMAYAGGYFTSPGDAQTSVYVLRRTSSGTTSTELFLNGSSARLTIASGRTVTFDILVVGREDNTGESAGYRLYGVIENVVGTTAIVGSVTVTPLAEDDTTWDVTVDAYDSYDSLRIRVQGGTGDTVRWVATVRTVEVSW